MPFTPLHLIPGVIIYLLFFPYVDLLALMAAALFLDVEPFVNLFILNVRPLHGLLHTLLGALLIGAPVATLCCRAVERRIPTLLRIFRAVGWSPDPRQVPLKLTVSSVYIGIAFHIILDYWAHEALPIFYLLDPSNALSSEVFDLWRFDLASYLLLWPHLLLYVCGLVLIPMAYVVGRRLHKERPFSHFP